MPAAAAISTRDRLRQRENRGLGHGVQPLTHLLYPLREPVRGGAGPFVSLPGRVSLNARRSACASAALATITSASLTRWPLEVDAEVPGQVSADEPRRRPEFTIPGGEHRPDPA